MRISIIFLLNLYWNLKKKIEYSFMNLHLHYLNSQYSTLFSSLFEITFTNWRVFRGFIKWQKVLKKRRKKERLPKNLRMFRCSSNMLFVTMQIKNWKILFETNKETKILFFDMMTFSLIWFFLDLKRMLDAH